MLMPLTMDVRLIIFSSLDQGLYNEVVTYFIEWKNMKTVLKKTCHLLIEKCALI